MQNTHVNPNGTPVKYALSGQLGVVRIHPTVTLGENVVFDGGIVILGANVTIGDGSRIGPSVEINAGTTVGDDARIMRCTIGEGVTIGKNVTLEELSVADGSTIGDGSTIRDY